MDGIPHTIHYRFEFRSRDRVMSRLTQNTQIQSETKSFINRSIQSFTNRLGVAWCQEITTRVPDIGGTPDFDFEFRNAAYYGIHCRVGAASYQDLYSKTQRVCFLFNYTLSHHHRVVKQSDIKHSIT